MNNKTLLLSAIFAAVLPALMPRPPALSRQTTTTTMAMAKPLATGPFKGAEVNGGVATLSGRTLKLSPDFKIPKAPAPTWQIVDKEGNAYLLKQINIVGGKTNRSVEIPGYVKSIAKVRIYCTFAEIVLGEAAFEEVVRLP